MCHNVDIKLIFPKSFHKHSPLSHGKSLGHTIVWCPATRHGPVSATYSQGAHKRHCESAYSGVPAGLADGSSSRLGPCRIPSKYDVLWS